MSPTPHKRGVEGLEHNKTHDVTDSRTQDMGMCGGATFRPGLRAAGLLGHMNLSQSFRPAAGVEAEIPQDISKTPQTQRDEVDDSEPKENNLTAPCHRQDAKHEENDVIEVAPHDLDLSKASKENGKSTMLDFVQSVVAEYVAEHNSNKRKSDALEAKVVEYIMSKRAKIEDEQFNMYLQTGGFYSNEKKMRASAQRQQAVDEDDDHVSLTDEEGDDISLGKLGGAAPPEVAQKIKKRAFDADESAEDEHVVSKRARVEEEEQKLHITTSDDPLSDAASRADKSPQSPIIGQERRSHSSSYTTKSSDSKRSIEPTIRTIIPTSAIQKFNQEMAAIKARVTAERARAEKKAAASAILGPRIRNLGFPKQSLGREHKPTGNTSANGNYISTKQAALVHTTSNCKEKRKSPDTEDSSGSSNKKQKRSAPKQEDIAKRAKAEGKVRRNSQTFGSTEKTDREDPQQAKPLSHLRKGKCRCVGHAKSLKLRELCEKGELKRAVTPPSNLSKEDSSNQNGHRARA